MPDKTDMLAEVETDLPDGIKNFLETVIPTLTATTAPTDEASSIIVQGILAHNLNTILKAFEGLTLAAIPLYIGQLNTVNQGLLCASLEVIEDTTTENGFEIINPKEGHVYLPGDVRFQVRPTNGQLQQVAVEIGALNPVALQWDDAGYFWGFARIEDEASYTANVSCLFIDDKDEEEILTGEVSFSIDTDADELAEGKDFGPIEYAYEAFKKAKTIADEAINAEQESKSLVNDVAAFARKYIDAVVKINKLSPLGQITTLINDLIDANSSRGLTPGDIQVITIMGELDNELTTVHSEAAMTYLQNNPHPPTGYATSPNLLKGAAAYMNETYGAGTVWYEGM